MKPVDMVRNTHLVVAVATVLAILTGNNLFGHCEVTNCNAMELCSSLSKSNHPSRKLMARNDRGFHILGNISSVAPKSFSASECLCIACTDTNRLNLDKNFSRSRLRYRHLLHAIILFSVDNDC